MFGAPSMGRSAYTNGLESRYRGNGRPMTDDTKTHVREVENQAPGWWSD